MKIVHVASECVPYCKTGGLADVLGALPKATAEKNHSVKVIIPLYSAIDIEKHQLRSTGLSIKVPIPFYRKRIEIWEDPKSTNPHVLFIKADPYFFRKGLYGDSPESAYPDNDLRYILFSWAIFELLKKINFSPDIIHAHDWHTALTAPLLRHRYRRQKFFNKTRSVFSIHNIAFQGIFPDTSYRSTGLPLKLFHWQGMEFYDRVNFMKGAIVYSDQFNTVSPGYSREVQEGEEYGMGLQGVIRQWNKKFRGILNGIDTDAWNPATDNYLQQNFSKIDLKNRKLNKAALQKEAGLPLRPSIPLLGFIGRLDRQKGVSILIDSAWDLLKKKSIQLVVLGKGDPFFENSLLELQAQYPHNVFIEKRFAEPLAHKIYGGCDFFLMPSIFEPCGLGQLIALRYGAIPIVTPTGGLKDTVRPYRTNQGWGFVSIGRSWHLFSHTVQQAIKIYRKPNVWKRLQHRAMVRNYSWNRSVREYLKMYRDAKKNH